MKERFVAFCQSDAAGALVWWFWASAMVAEVVFYATHLDRGEFAVTLNGIMVCVTTRKFVLTEVEEARRRLNQ